MTPRPLTPEEIAKIEYERKEAALRSQRESIARWDRSIISGNMQRRWQQEQREAVKVESKLSDRAKVTILLIALMTIIAVIIVMSVRWQP